MTKSVFFLSLLLLLVAAASATAVPGNATSGLSYDGCAPGATVGECITATVEEEDEEEGVEAVVRRIMKQKRRSILYDSLQGGKSACKGAIAGNCIGLANVGKGRTCEYYHRCKRNPREP